MVTTPGRDIATQSSRNREVEVGGQRGSSNRICARAVTRRTGVCSIDVEKIYQHGVRVK